MAVFFCGALQHAPLRDVVLGGPYPVKAASAPGFQGLKAAEDGNIGLRADPDAAVEGWLAADLAPGPAARLSFYASAIGLAMQPLTVSAQGGVVAALAPVANAGAKAPGWDTADWLRAEAELAVATARDIMESYGHLPPHALRARIGPLRVRAASRLRAAQDDLPTTLRRRGGTVQIVARHQPYAHFFAVEEYDLRFERFDGSLGDPVNRAAFVSGDAVTVLPYDPARDRVLLVEQFRTGPMARGDTNPWQIEAIAGRIDPGESPQDCARREAVEEAGLTLGRLLPVARYYASPGAKTEFLYSYVALADLPDTAAGVFGMAEEAEDIRGHVIGFDQLMAMVASGEVSNAPLILTALWLQRERSGLRA